MAALLHRVALSWILLVLPISMEAAQHDSIITPPNDVTGNLGGTAKFQCEVDFTELAWEFNNQTLYSLQSDKEHYPKGNIKYFVARKGKTFTLRINDLKDEDGGTYTCRVLDQTADATLNVTETVKHQSILTPPSDATRKVGETAKFKCEVKFGSIRVMSWEFNNKIIYSLSYEHEDYPLGTARYSVAKDGGNFTLTVKDIRHSDAGNYTCRVLNEAEKAKLNVTETKEPLILTSPSDVTGKLGGNAEFNCKVEFTSIKVMQWRFNQEIIYTLEYDHESFPKGSSRYFVVHDGRNSTLTVKDLQYSDSGVYTCQVPKQAETANLIVAGPPKLSNSPSIPVEGSSANYNCTAPFTGPQKEDIASSHYPQLLMFFDDKQFNGTVIEDHVEGSSIYYKLTQTYHLKLEARMHGKILTCAIRTSSPEMQLNTTTTVEVLYPVRNVNYTPDRASYEVGTVINCRADGNPEPHFQWESADNTIKGNALEITKEMVGSNNWTCVAGNIINGQLHHRTRIATFEAVFPEKQEKIGIQSSHSDSWKIAVAVVSVCGVVGCLAAVFYIRCFRNNLPCHGQPDNEEAEVAQNLLPLEEIHSRGQVEDPDQTEINPLIKIIDNLKCEDDCTEQVVKMAQDLLPDQTFPTEGPPALRLLKIVKNYFGADSKGENRQIQNGDTVLHKMASWANIWKNYPEKFLEVVRYYKIDSNIDVKNDQSETALNVFTSKAGEGKEHVSIGNINVRNDNGMTALHIFTTNAGEWKKQPKTFWEVIRCLLSPNNIDFVDFKKGSTALHIFISEAGDWQHHSDEFVVVINYLLTSTNIDITNSVGETPLHVFTKGAGNWSMYPNEFFKVVEILKSSKNYDMTNIAGESALCTFLQKAEWTDQPEIFFQVVDCLKSELNINIRTHSNKTVLHIFTSKASKWYYNPETFLKIVKCLRSASNINFKDNDDVTALHLFTSQGDEWKDHPDKFLEVVKCLTSSENIYFLTKSKNTALGNFTQYENAWKEHNNIFLNVVRCLFFHAKGKTERDEVSFYELSEWMTRMLKTPGGSFEVLKLMSSPAIIRLEQNNEFIFFQMLRNTFKDREGDQSPIPITGNWKTHYMEVFKNFVSSHNLRTMEIEGNTALHTFISIGKNFTEYPVFLDVVKFLTSDHNSSLYLNVKNADGNTALHIFAAQAQKWSNKHQIFFDVITCLKTTKNIGMQNNEGKTALFSFTDTATKSLWADHPDTFAKVVNCLRSTTNINLKSERGRAPLHRIVAGVKTWGDHPVKFLELVKKLKSENNINFRDNDGDTVLHYLFVPFLNWENLDELRLEIKRSLHLDHVEMIIESGNEADHRLTIKVKTGYGYVLDGILKFIKLNLSHKYRLATKNDGWKEIQIFNSERKKWKDSAETFLQVVESLKSPININYQGEDNETAIHLFARCKLTWADTPKIIKCLRSPENIVTKNNKGQTPKDLLGADYFINDVEEFLQT